MKHGDDQRGRDTAATSKRRSEGGRAVAVAMAMAMAMARHALAREDGRRCMREMRSVTHRLVGRDYRPASFRECSAEFGKNPPPYNVWPMGIETTVNRFFGHAYGHLVFLLLLRRRA